MDEDDTATFLATYAGESKLKGYKVGLVESKEGVKGKSKLSKLSVNIGKQKLSREASLIDNLLQVPKSLFKLLQMQKYPKANE